MAFNFNLPTARSPELIPDFVRSLCDLGPSTIAVFDADGTLWRDDVADDFTQWMMSEGHITGELWAEYLGIYKDDHPAGCRFLLSLYAGLSRGHMQALAQQWWQVHAHRQWIPEVLETLHYFADAGCPVWIVTGSPTDTMGPLASCLPIEQILGMDFALDASGVITGELAGISCTAGGKAEKIRENLGPQQRVVFVAGNGSLDAAMMDIAEGAAWSIHPDPAFEAMSRARGWPVLARPDDFVQESKLA